MLVHNVMLMCDLLYIFSVDKLIIYARWTFFCEKKIKNYTSRVHCSDCWFKPVTAYNRYHKLLSVHKKGVAAYTCRQEALLRTSSYIRKVWLLIYVHLQSLHLLWPFPLYEWNTSNIVLIPKCSPPSSSLSNFRPISLLSLVSKLLEKHVHSILLDFCFNQNLISPYQFGFLT